MSKPQFVYVTYINTTPEKLWNALIDGEMTRQYWEHLNVSDWKPGSRWEHRRTDAAGTVDVAGTVVESTPPRRLIITWAETASSEKQSRVTFVITPLDGKVQLTVVHDEFEPGSKMLESISNGWPRVLSSLKSFLETGTALRTWT